MPQELANVLIKHNQIPETVEDPKVLVEYLKELMTDNPFAFRHAPLTQSEMEERWLDEEKDEEEYDDWERFPKHL